MENKPALSQPLLRQLELPLLFFFFFLSSSHFLFLQTNEKTNLPPKSRGREREGKARRQRNRSVDERVHACFLSVVWCQNAVCKSPECIKIPERV